MAEFLHTLATSGMLSAFLVVMGIGILVGSLLVISATMSNGHARDKNWPPSECTPNTDARRKTGFTRGK